VTAGMNIEYEPQKAGAVNVKCELQKAGTTGERNGPKDKPTCSVISEATRADSEYLYDPGQHDSTQSSHLSRSS